MYESGLLYYSTQIFLLFGSWIQLVHLAKSIDWLDKWVTKILSIFAEKLSSTIYCSQYIIGNLVNS